MKLGASRSTGWSLFKTAVRRLPRILKFFGKQGRRRPLLMQNRLSSRIQAANGNDAFAQWSSLTDAYAKQFLLLQRGDRSARVGAIKMATELRRLTQAISIDRRIASVGLEEFAQTGDEGRC